MNTHDITIRFHEAAKKITAGRLVKDDHFSLFEAVGALEIGDPKMDSGCLEPGETLDDNFDMTIEFLPEELIWLMDQMLNREVAWLMGYPLSQTLFTSVHIDRLLWPELKTLGDAHFVRGRTHPSLSLSHQILRAYCLSLIKACDFVLAMVTSQHYYEEEDFTTQLFNRDLLHQFSGDEVNEITIAAIGVLEQSDMVTGVKQALRTRLDFRSHVLEMFMYHADARAPSRSLFDILRHYIVGQQKSQQYGKMVPGAFSTKLQRRLASTVPPRPMVTVSMDQVWSFWSQMLKDCENVFSVQIAECSQDLFTSYMMFAYRIPQPSTYPRALLQSFVAINDGLVGGRIDPLHFIEEDLRSLTLPASQLLSISSDRYGSLYNGEQRIAQYMQTFVDKFENTFNNLYRALCLNGCRIRRTFCHALVEWDSRQGEIEELDTLIQSELREQPIPYMANGPPTFAYPLSSWVYHHKLNILRLTVQMGFDQMIYASHELAGMYSYLSSICNMHMSHLERISHFVTAKEVAVRSSRMRSTSKQDGMEECKQALDRLFRQYAWVKATHMLATTLHYIFIILRRTGIFLPSGPFYSSDDLRYEIRMKPFLSLSAPEPLSPEDHENETLMQHVETESLLEQASDLSSAARKAWEEIARTSWHISPVPQHNEDTMSESGSRLLNQEWNMDVKDCVKASIAASLCTVSLKKMLRREDWVVRTRKEAEVASIGEKGRWHRWWVVPSLPVS